MEFFRELVKYVSIALAVVGTIAYFVLWGLILKFVFLFFVGGYTSISHVSSNGLFGNATASASASSYATSTLIQNNANASTTQTNNATTSCNVGSK